MKYSLFTLDGALLMPSNKAKCLYLIPETWSFDLSELLEVLVIDGLPQVSKPLYVLAQKIQDEKQIDYLLELISIIKKRDVHRQINWDSTNQIIAKCRLFNQFLQGEEAKQIDEKYHSLLSGIPKRLSIRQAVQRLDELQIAFKKWIKQ